MTTTTNTQNISETNTNTAVLASNDTVRKCNMDGWQGNINDVLVKLSALTRELDEILGENAQKDFGMQFDAGTLAATHQKNQAHDQATMIRCDAGAQLATGGFSLATSGVTMGRYYKSANASAVSKAENNLTHLNKQFDKIPGPDIVVGANVQPTLNTNTIADATQRQYVERRITELTGNAGPKENGWLGSSKPKVDANGNEQHGSKMTPKELAARDAHAVVDDTNPFDTQSHSVFDYMDRDQRIQARAHLKETVKSNENDRQYYQDRLNQEAQQLKAVNEVVTNSVTAGTGFRKANYQVNAGEEQAEATIEALIQQTSQSSAQAMLSAKDKTNDGLASAIQQLNQAMTASMRG